MNSLDGGQVTGKNIAVNLGALAPQSGLLHQSRQKEKTDVNFLLNCRSQSNINNMWNRGERRGINRALMTNGRNQCPVAPRQTKAVAVELPPAAEDTELRRELPDSRRSLRLYSNRSVRKCLRPHFRRRAQVLTIVENQVKP